MKTLRLGQDGPIALVNDRNKGFIYDLEDARFAPCTFEFLPKCKVVIRRHDLNTSVESDYWLTNDESALGRLLTLRHRQIVALLEAQANIPSQFRDALNKLENL